MDKKSPLLVPLFRPAENSRRAGIRTNKPVRTNTSTTFISCNIKKQKQKQTNTICKTRKKRKAYYSCDSRLLRILRRVSKRSFQVSLSRRRQLVRGLDQEATRNATETAERRLPGSRAATKFEHWTVLFYRKVTAKQIERGLSAVSRDIEN